MSRPLPYRLKFSAAYLWSLVLFHFAPLYLSHLVRRPYRRGIILIDYKLPELNRRRSRWFCALYDMLFNLVLDGYVQLTGLHLAPATGKILVLLIELTRHLDEHLDQKLGSGISLDLKEVLAASPIQEQRMILRQYLQQFACAELMLAHLEQLFATYYDTYIHLLSAVRNVLQFEEVLQAAQIDTGIWLRSLIELVAIFNGHELDAETRQQFYLLGMACKFIDDLDDVVGDVKKGHPNLFYALIHQNEVERAALQQGIQQKQRLNALWWNTHCPATYIQYFEHIQHYYNQLRASKLQLVCDLLLLPAITGFLSPEHEYQSLSGAGTL